ncbi:MAG: hypothetical protein ACO2PN_14745 [Pyrobaculum sp.]|jgi:hypothetical protein
MLKIKKGLVNILEENRNNNEPEEAAPQPPQPQTPQTHTALKLNELETPQPPQLLRSIEPAVQPPPPRQAARQVCDQVGWEEHLMLALAKAPEDVAQKLVALIDREVLMKVLEKRDDPYLRVALLLLTKK